MKVKNILAFALALGVDVLQAYFGGFFTLWVFLVAFLMVLSVLGFFFK